MRTNLLTNPNFETNTTGWAVINGSTLSSSADRAWNGTKSLKVVYDATARALDTTGTQYSNFPMINGATLTFSAYVWVPTGQPAVKIKFGGPSYNVTGTTSTTNDQWERLTVTTTATNTNNANLQLLNAATSVPSSTGFYVDGALLEIAPSAGTYFDGDFANSTWTGTPHGSTSYYSVDTPAPPVRTNLLTNPNFETNLTGWDNPGTRAALSTATAPVRAGTNSMKVTHNGAHTAGLAGTGTASVSLTGGLPYTYSAWVYVPAGQPRVTLSVSGGITATGTTNTKYDAWERLWVTVYPSSGVTATFGLLNADTTANGTNFYVDSALLEAVNYVGVYFDGSTTSTWGTYAWTGSANASTSTETLAPVRTNLVRNPDFHQDVAWWSGVGAGTTITRSVGRWVNDVASLNFQIPVGTAPGAAVLSTTVTGLTIGQAYSVSAWAYLANGLTNAVQMSVMDGATNRPGSTTSLSGIWELLKVNYTATATTATINFANTTTTVTQVQNLFIDVVTFQTGTDQEPFSGNSTPLAGIGYRWLGQAGSSASVEVPLRENLMRNPSFETGTKYGWNGTPAASTTAIDTAIKHRGTYSLRVDILGTFVKVLGTNGSGQQAEMIPVTPGKRYTMSMWCYADHVQAMQCYAGGANASGVITNTYPGMGNNNTTANRWVRMSCQFTAAPGDYYVYPIIDFLGTNGNKMWVDDVMVEEGGGLGAYFDGDVTDGWVANRWAATEVQYLSRSQQTLATVTKPAVKGVYTGAVVASNPTVSLPVTPASTDVLIVLSMGFNNPSDTIASAMSGCGATWTRIPGGMDHVTAWMGVAPTSSGTITATAGAITTGRALRLYHLSGVSPTAVMRGSVQASLNGALNAATPNQVVIGLAYSGTTTETPLHNSTNKIPLNGWVDQAELAPTTTRRWVTTHLIPKATTDVLARGYNATGLIIVGSPVFGSSVVRRNLAWNTSMEDNQAWSTLGITLTSVSTPVHSGFRAIGSSTSTTARLIPTSALPYAPVATGRTYTFSFYAYCTSARTAGVIPSWYRVNESSLSTETYAVQATLVANTWTRVVGTYTAPAEACFATAELRVESTTGDSVYFDSFQIEEGSSATEFFYGDSTPPAGYLNTAMGTSTDWLTRSSFTYPTVQTQEVVNPYVRQNLVKNPRFGSGSLAGWATNSNHTLAYDTSSPIVGSYSIKITNTSGGSAIPQLFYGAQFAGSSNTATASAWAIPATPGESIRVATYIRTLVNFNWLLGRVIWFNAAGTQISTSDFGYQAVSPSAWSGKATTLTAPANTASYAVGLSGDATSNTSACGIGAMFSAKDIQGGFFDGETASTADYSYAWDGIPHASTSSERKLRRRNIASNPSAETNTTAWGANFGGTLSASSTVALFGTQSVKMLMSGTTGQVTVGYDNTNYELGVYTYSASVSVYSTVAATITMYHRTADGQITPTTAVTLAPNTWTRISRSNLILTSYSTYAVWFDISTVASGDIVYFDGFLVERTLSAGSYFDGSSYALGQTHAWIGTAHGSNSVQTPQPVLFNVATMKHRESGTWVQRVSKPQVLVGGSWVNPRMLTWNGSSWVPKS